MGKKKAQKTKELSVAIGEASSIGDESGQTQSQSQSVTPRKRGRPRKIVEKTEGEGENKEAVQQSAASVVAAEESWEKPLEKSKSSEEERHGLIPQVDSSACMWINTKEEGVSQEKQLPKGEPSRSRRARRKSKPTKSS